MLLTFLSYKSSQNKRKWRKESLFKQFPKVYFNKEVGNYIVKVASTPAERLQVLKLRYQVFQKECRGRRSFFGGIDVDKYDSKADYLMLVDKKRNKLLGAYRILISKDPQDFYSYSEFEFSDDFLGHTYCAELSRACIHPEARQGIVLGVLWEGLSLYLRKAGVKTLFGCSSLFGQNSQKVKTLMAYLRESDGLSEGMLIQPKPSYDLRLSEQAQEGGASGGQMRRKDLPPLLRGYLSAGAKVCSWPAWDGEFQCFDVLTRLDMDSVSRRYQRKYFS